MTVPTHIEDTMSTLQRRIAERALIGLLAALTATLVCNISPMKSLVSQVARFIINP